ncbi:MAG: SDR family oxidoreductase [Bacteroidales bacterium]|nr:SDR family oxidoreductase [Bacteroidales bacterium]
MKSIKNQTIIVTGGASGIGGGITRKLIEMGAVIIVVDINEEAGYALAEEFPNQTTFVKGDVSKVETAEEAVATAILKSGKLTGLVNNVHASRQKPLLEHTQADWDLSFNTGFQATLQFMLAAYPELKKTGGSIVNFGSGAALSGSAFQASYAAVKEAIRGLSRVVATEWAADNIRVNVVCPVAYTEGVQDWKTNFPEEYERVLNQVPLGRFGDPKEDIAPIVAFLLSEDSQYMTGQTLMADGGDIKLR